MDSVIENIVKVQHCLVSQGQDGDLCLFLSGEHMALIIMQMRKNLDPVSIEELKTTIVIHTQFGKITGIWNGE